MKPDSNREWRSLEDIAVVCGGGSMKLSSADFVESGVPAFGAGGQNGLVETAEFDQVGIVLSANGARCGKCFLTPASWTSMANTQVILPDAASVDAGFLWYQLNDENRWPKSGTAQPFIKPSDVKRHRVWLPPLDEQRRIADVLDRADALRAKRRETLVRLNELTQSIFVDMFGRRSWPEKPVGELATSENRSRIPLKASDRSKRHGSFPYYGATGAIDTIDDWTHEGRRVLVGEDGADYFAKRRPVAFEVDGRYWVNNHAHVLAAGPEVTLGYLRFALNAVDYRGVVTGTAQLKLTKRNLDRIMLPVPPIELQAAFDERLRTLAVARRDLAQSAMALDTLFASIQQRAFRGDLFSSDLPDELEDVA